jgi:hypothetical protein
MKTTYLILTLLLISAAASAQNDTGTTSPLYIQQSEQRIDNFEKGMDKFRKSRTAAKGVQAVGAVALLAYFVLNNKYEKDLSSGATNAKKPPSALPIIGSAGITIGLLMDLGAGEHLRIKRP